MNTRNPICLTAQLRWQSSNVPFPYLTSNPPILLNKDLLTMNNAPVTANTSLEIQVLGFSGLHPTKGWVISPLIFTPKPTCCTLPAGRIGLVDVGGNRSFAPQTPMVVSSIRLTI